jgi:hypothetical protein
LALYIFSKMDHLIQQHMSCPAIDAAANAEYLPGALDNSVAGFRRQLPSI